MIRLKRLSAEYFAFMDNLEYVSYDNLREYRDSLSYYDIELVRDRGESYISELHVPEDFYFRTILGFKS